MIRGREADVLFEVDRGVRGVLGVFGVLGGVQIELEPSLRPVSEVGEKTFVWVVDRLLRLVEEIEMVKGARCLAARRLRKGLVLVRTQEGEGTLTINAGGLLALEEELGGREERSRGGRDGQEGVDGGIMTGEERRKCSRLVRKQV